MVKPRILLYCPLAPSTPKIYARCLQSIFALEWGEPLDMVFGRADHAPTGREQAYNEITDKYNAARRMALEGGYDALFTVESDMILPPLTLERLTRAGVDVAYGLYISRHGRHDWLAFASIAAQSGVSYSRIANRARDAWGQVVETEGVGMGCTLIWRRVLEAIEFRRVPGYMANDWQFSLDCKAAGFVQAHDFGVACGHMDERQIYWPDPQAGLLYSVEPLAPVRAAAAGETLEIRGAGVIWRTQPTQS